MKTAGRGFRSSVRVVPIAGDAPIGVTDPVVTVTPDNPRAEQHLRAIAEKLLSPILAPLWWRVRVLYRAAPPRRLGVRSCAILNAALRCARIGGFTGSLREWIVVLAAQHRIPVIYVCAKQSLPAA